MADITAVLADISRAMCRSGDNLIKADTTSTILITHTPNLVFALATDLMADFRTTAEAADNLVLTTLTAKAASSPLRRTRMLLFSTMGILIITMMMVFLYLYGDKSASAQRDFGSKLEACQDKVIRLGGRPVLDSLMLRDVYYLCYTRVRSEEELQDWSTRKSDFVHQRLENDVILAMVVLITLSGVLLAGIQLYVSFVLASNANSAFLQDNELSFEQSKISLKSSYVGVVVLFLSLAFFFVYIKFVYVLDEVNIPVATGASAQTQLAKQ